MCTFLFVCVSTFPTQKKSHITYKKQKQYRIHVDCIIQLRIQATYTDITFCMEVYYLRTVIAGTLSYHYKELATHKIRKAIYICVQVLHTYRIHVYHYPTKNSKRCVCITRIRGKRVNPGKELYAWDFIALHYCALTRIVQLGFVRRYSICARRKGTYSLRYFLKLFNITMSVVTHNFMQADIS